MASGPQRTGIKISSSARLSLWQCRILARRIRSQSTGSVQYFRPQVYKLSAVKRLRLQVEYSSTATKVIGVVAWIDLVLRFFLPRPVFRGDIQSADGVGAASMEALLDGWGEDGVLSDF